MKHVTLTRNIALALLIGSTALQAEDSNSMPFNVVQQKIDALEAKVQTSESYIKQLNDNDIALDKRLKNAEKTIAELNRFKASAEALLEVLKDNDHRTHEEYLKISDRIGKGGSGGSSKLAEENAGKLKTMNEDIDVLFEKMLDMKSAMRNSKGGADNKQVAENTAKLKTMNEDIDVVFEKILDMKSDMRNSGDAAKIAKANEAKLKTLNEDIDVLFEKMLDMKASIRGAGDSTKLAQANEGKLKTMNEDIDVLFEKMLDMKSAIRDAKQSSDVKAFDKKQPEETSNAPVPASEIAELREIAEGNSEKLNMMNDDVEVLFEKIVEMKKSLDEVVTKVN